MMLYTQVQDGLFTRFYRNINSEPYAMIYNDLQIGKQTKYIATYIHYPLSKTFDSFEEAKAFLMDEKLQLVIYELLVDARIKNGFSKRPLSYDFANEFNIKAKSTQTN